MGPRRLLVIEQDDWDGSHVYYLIYGPDGVSSKPWRTVKYSDERIRQAAAEIRTFIGEASLRTLGAGQETGRQRHAWAVSDESSHAEASRLTQQRARVEEDLCVLHELMCRVDGPDTSWGEIERRFCQIEAILVDHLTRELELLGKTGQQTRGSQSNVERPKRPR